ncbi:MAG: Xaa-Pro peptidase family protein [Clostridiales bacterium]|jgi:Xaa-Pro aminopeptidase|nr:Xaa-Pro peptidase family protein [Clostridiales bacterium]
MSKFPTIRDTEFEARIKALREKMSGRGVDACVAFSNLLDPSAVRYFCDFAAVNESAALVVPASGPITVCSGQASYDYALVKNRLKGAEVRVFPEIGEVSGFEYNFEGQSDFETYFKGLKAKGKIKKIALMGKLIFPAVIYNKLARVFSDAEIVDFDGELYELRLIKSAAELACMEKCAEAISGVFASAAPKIRAGMTERKIQALFENAIYSAGAESWVQAFAPMIASGPVNSHISMCRNSLRKVRNSEIVSLAAGLSCEGYNGIICSPYVLGEIPAEIRDAVKCAYDALNEASGKMKPGVTADIVLNAYADYLEKYGYLEFCPYGSLHSTGMLECEAPVFSAANRRELRENMTVCIDAYFKGMAWGSFRVEDMYVIGRGGAKRMTTYNDAFIPAYFK